MNDSSLNRVLELALHALVSERCKLSYLHDLRNGLQGIYSCFDALTRLLKGTAPASVSVEKATDFARKSIVSHEKSLERILGDLLPSEADSVSACTGESLREVVKFLNGDAAAHGVSLRVTANAVLHASVPPHTLRLTLLSLMVDAIDAMPDGGELHSEARELNGKIAIDIAISPTNGVLNRNYDTAWQLDLPANPQRNDLTFYVVRRLVEAAAGTIDHLPHDGGRKITIQYPAVGASDQIVS